MHNSSSPHRPSIELSEVFMGLLGLQTSWHLADLITHNLLQCRCDLEVFPILAFPKSYFIEMLLESCRPEMIFSHMMTQR